MCPHCAWLTFLSMGDWSFNTACLWLKIGIGLPILFRSSPSPLSCAVKVFCFLWYMGFWFDYFLSLYYELLFLQVLSSPMYRCPHIFITVKFAQAILLLSNEWMTILLSPTKALLPSVRDMNISLILYSSQVSHTGLHVTGRENAVDGRKGGGSENLRRLEFTTRSNISSLATHIPNLAEILFGFVAHAICRDGVGIKMSSGTGAIAILNNRLHEHRILVQVFW